MSQDEDTLGTVCFLLRSQRESEKPSVTGSPFFE